MEVLVFPVPRSVCIYFLQTGRGSRASVVVLRTPPPPMRLQLWLQSLFLHLLLTVSTFHHSKRNLKTKFVLHPVKQLGVPF